MPANKKYFSSPTQRVAKISAGFLGGYLVTVSFFLQLSLWFDRASTVVTMIFGGFILWSGLLICSFLFKNGWYGWLLYLVLTAVFSSIFYFNNPA